MLIYTDGITLHRRQLHLNTNKQMSERLVIAVHNLKRFQRETEQTSRDLYNIQPEICVIAWGATPRAKCSEG